MLSADLKLKRQGFSLDLTGLRCRKGEILCLFGSSGAGKTTALELLSGLLKSTDSTILFGGTIWQDARCYTKAQDRSIGYIFQDYALFPHLTVAQNIAYGLRDLPQGQMQSRVEEMIGLFQLEGFENRFPGSLSGGQKQMVALARALARRPGILLLDEPFSALDSTLRRDLQGRLLELKALGDQAIILVTHDLHEAVAVADHMLLLSEGRIIQSGAPRDIVEKPETVEVARLTGAINIFAATYAAGKDGGCTLTAESDVLELRKEYAARSELSGKVDWCIRPENVMIVRPDRPLKASIQENILSARVLSVVPGVDRFEVDLGVSFGILKGTMPPHVQRKLNLVPGQHVRVALKKESIHLLRDKHK